MTPNDPKDADLGPNRLQNFPIISRATAVSSVTTYVRYTLSSEPSRTYRLEFFAGPQPDPSGNGEGKTYLGTTQVMTNAAGAATGSMNLPGGIAAGSYVTATATPMGGGASAGSTSEFSPAVQAAGLRAGRADGSSPLRPWPRRRRASADARPRRRGRW